MAPQVTNQEMLFAFKDFLESALTVYLPTTLFLAALDVARRKSQDEVLNGVRVFTVLVLMTWFHIRFQQFMAITGLTNSLKLTATGQYVFFGLIALAGAIAIFLIDFLAMKLSKVVEI